jgi:putative two-component system response regulator
MVVDDNPDQIYTVTQILIASGENYEIFKANSATECIEILEKNKIPDLILLDIMMPEINGWELAKKLKKNEKWEKIPIIFLTARKSKIARTAGGWLGEDYIEKPFDGPDLIKRIENILKRIND